MNEEVTTYYLEMKSLSEFKRKNSTVEGFEIIKCDIPLPEYNRFFYLTVGSPWQWIDKLSWSLEQWREYVERDDLHTWVGYLHGTPAGYFELEKQPDKSVLLAYFGLIPQFIGKGLGSMLLSKAIECAWEMGASRVWLHTCTRDHAHALGNYQARGFKIYKTEVDPIREPPLHIGETALTPPTPLSQHWERGEKS